MASVTQVIRKTEKPGRFLKPSSFEKIELTDDKVLKEENIRPGLIGTAVDYLTRFMLGEPAKKAFEISLLGAKNAKEEERAYNLLKDIIGLDDFSVYNACKLVGYDVCYRVGFMGYVDIDGINADIDTITNIKIMVQRTITLLKSYGPVIKSGVTFEGGYTKRIDCGDGDFLTFDTLWDLKVSKSPPTSSQTLQLLIYYIMGSHSIHDEFKGIKRLGIFNPRTNCVYIKNISDISQNIINEVSSEIIGYNTGLTISSTVKPTTEDIINESSSEKEDMLPIVEIMRKLSCTRYMVMKYYAENDLPLVKIKNQYFINKRDLIIWKNQIEKEKKKEEQERQAFARKIIHRTIVFFIIMILLLVFILRKF